MSFKHAGTAGDLVRFGASLRIECSACSAARTMSGAEVVRRCGAGPLPAIRARLKCDRCNTREAQLTVLPPV